MATTTSLTTSGDGKITVIIVGAGLAGLSLALGLTQGEASKFHVHLVEKQFNFNRTGATFGLQPNGKKALNEIAPGVVDELEKIGLFIPQSGGTMLGWWHVRDVLLENVQASQNDKIKLHTGWLMQQIIDDEDSVRAIFLKRDTNGETTDETLSLEGSIVIGADGVNSSVRQQLGLPKAKETSIMMWRTRIYVPPTKEDPDSTPAADTLRDYLDIPIVPMGIRLRGAVQYVLFNFHQKQPGTMALVANYKVDDPADLDEITPGTSPQKLLEPKAEDDKELQEIKAIAELADHDGLHHPVKQKVVMLPDEDGKGWGGKGHISLIGDAAHALRPASGQGGSMAFEDAVILCRVLQKFVSEDSPHNKQAVEAALKEYENTRLPRVRKMWNDQWERSEATYKNIELEPWSEEFSNWVYQGV